MSEDFRDEFSEDDLNRLTGGVDPDAVRYRALQRAVWEYFEAGLPVGDGRQIGMIVIVEIATQGGTAIRFHSSDAEGYGLPSWRSRGYLHEMLVSVDDMSPQMQIERPTDEE